MQLNYFGAVKLMLAVLPGMRERQAGPHHQHLEHRHAGLPAAVRRLRRVEVGAGGVQPLHRSRGRRTTASPITNIHMPLVRTPMIAPTGMYKNFPTSSPDEAAEMVASAILTRAPEVSTRLGKVGETVNAVAPGLLQFVMTGAYHVFPETGAARTATDGQAEAGGRGDLSRGGGDGLPDEGHPLLAARATSPPALRTSAGRICSPTAATEAMPKMPMPRTKMTGSARITPRMTTRARWTMPMIMPTVAIADALLARLLDLAAGHVAGDDRDERHGEAADDRDDVARRTTRCRRPG